MRAARPTMNASQNRVWRLGFAIATTIAGVSAFTMIGRSSHDSRQIIPLPSCRRHRVDVIPQRTTCCRSHNNPQDGCSAGSSDILLPPNCKIYLPSFALTTTLEETSDWEWVLWDNRPMESVSLVSSSSSTTLTPRLDNPILAAAATAAWETWRWCANVVVPLQLCPWASLSVQTPNAIRMYLVVESPTTASIRNSVDHLDQATLSEQRMQQALASAVHHWWKDIQQPDDDNNEISYALDPKSAIAFCVDARSKTTTARKSGIISVTNAATSVDPTNNELQTNSDQLRHTNLDYVSSHVWDFNAFYDWFVDLEENQNWWRRSSGLNDYNNSDDDDDNDDVAEQITLAPFHPHWEYYGDSDVNDGDDGDKSGNEERGCWAFEKKSPHPTISMVATAVVEQAGAAVTERIAINNADVLTKLGTDQLSKLYRDQVWL